MRSGLVEAACARRCCKFFCTGLARVICRWSSSGTFLICQVWKNMSHVWCLSICIDASMYVCFLRFLTRAIQKYSISILWFFIWWVGRSSTNFPTAKLFWFFIRKGSIKKWRFWFYQMIGSLFDLGLPACVWGIPGFKFDVVPLNDVCWNFENMTSWSPHGVHLTFERVI